MLKKLIMDILMENSEHGGGDCRDLTAEVEDIAELIEEAIKLKIQAFLEKE
jgi:hypothetical protein